MADDRKKLVLVEIFREELTDKSGRYEGKRIYAVDPTCRGLTFMGRIIEHEGKPSIQSAGIRAIEALPDYYRLFIEKE